ncbi:MAG: RluA family pseudouridine synthase [Clostridiales bacterium]|nr:RluA family pseudouridine synthase [Clostridiales bacterium]
MNTEIVTVTDELSGIRADKLLTSVLPDLSRSAVQALMEKQAVLLGGKPIDKKYLPKAGDVIVIEIPEPEQLSTQPENIPLDIRYEDDDLLVVNKPKGMVVHPAVGNCDGTLVNALLYHCGASLSGINGVIRPGIVHRIDKDTSGLLIVAKNDFSHAALAEQIKVHSFKREYRAVVVGTLKQDEGTVDAPLGRSVSDRKKQAVTDKNSRSAVTHYSVIERYRNFTYTALRLETGRTHQIRVHMAYIGHPVAGDAVYGNPKKTYGLDGQCLHAGLIGFVHPRSGEYIEISSELPEYFTSFLGRIQLGGKEWS